MSKFVLPPISTQYDERDIEFKYGEASPEISHSLYDYLSTVKKQIESHNEIWDNIKKFTNPYEFIHGGVPGYKTPISKLKPLSRSFYKMIEIVHTFDIFPVVSNKENIFYNADAAAVSAVAADTAIKTFHLAEGPGGFIEATAFLRKNSNDMYYGMTLVSQDPKCPGWKKSKQFLDDNENVFIEVGSDGTGNLLSIENYNHCYNNYRETMDVITGDAGIDFSDNYNKQENMALKLIIAQVLYAITMQKNNGHFILKVFDTFTTSSIDILYLLSSLYKEVYITKPKTSRYANSEKYIVCKFFKLNQQKHNFYNIIKGLIRNFEFLLQSHADDEICNILRFNVDYKFKVCVEEINAIIGKTQIEIITKTLNLIYNKGVPHCDKIDAYKNINILKCINWCEKYNIPYYKTLQAVNIFLKQRT